MEQLWLFLGAKHYYGPAPEKRAKPASRRSKLLRGATKYVAAAMLAAASLQPTLTGLDDSVPARKKNLDEIASPAMLGIPVESAYGFMRQGGAGYLRGIGDEKSDYMLLVDKDTQTASVYRLKLEKVDSTSVSTGRVAGNKEREGDMKTPNGIFQVVSQYNSSGWMHDGKRGEYGSHFSRLNAGAWDRSGHFYANRQSSIGVHGTNQPEKIGTRASEGCIRLPNGKNNEYVAKGIIKDGTIVAVIGDGYGK